MAYRVFRLLELMQNFINDRRVVTPRESKRFQVIKFIGEIRRIRANMYSTIDVSIEGNHFLLRRIMRKSMRWERETEKDFRKTIIENRSTCLEINASRKECCHFQLKK